MTEPIREIVRAYDSPVVRAYCRVRFQILRPVFLREIGQYLPREGRALDLGCGFGLFSLYFSLTRPDLAVTGLDRNERRIELARAAARRVGADRARYECVDLREYDDFAGHDAVYVLDVLHHLPRPRVLTILDAVHAGLAEGQRFVVKDVDTRPWPKRLFTHALDLLVDPRSPPSYWSAEEMTGALEHVGFEVHRHRMLDFLPYPHVIYACTKRRRSPRADVVPAEQPTAAGG